MKNMKIKSALCIMILAVITFSFCMPLHTAGAASRYSYRDQRIEELLEEGERLIAKVPNPFANLNIRGYSYRRSFDDQWQLVCTTMDILRLDVPSAFKSITGDGCMQYILSAAIAMCSRAEPIEWLYSDHILELVKDLEEAKDFTKLLTDERTVNSFKKWAETNGEQLTGEDYQTFDDLISFGKAARAAGLAIDTWDTAIDYLNTMRLVDNIDQRQMSALSLALRLSDDNEMKRAGEMLDTFNRYEGNVRSFVLYRDALREFGMDLFLSKFTSAVLKAALKGTTGTVGMIYSATLIGLEWFSGVGALTGIAYDMSYAYKMIDPCWHDFNLAKNTDYTPRKEHFFDGDDRTLLKDSFEELMYVGINMAEAAANMEEVFVKFVETANKTLGAHLPEIELGPINLSEYINSDVLAASRDAADHVTEYRELADQLRDLLGQLRLILNTEGPDSSEVWVRHWTMLNHPEHTLDITRNGDGTLHMKAHFDHADDFECDFDPYDYEAVEFGDSSDKLYGMLLINADTGRLEASLYSNFIHRGDPLFPFIMYSEEETTYGIPQIYITDNPPDLSSYGGKHQNPAFYDDAHYHIPSPEQSRQLLAELSQHDLIASSGAGAWAAQLHVDADGLFNGYYYDEDAETVYESSFTGILDVASTEWWGDSIYALRIGEISTKDTPGSEAVSDLGAKIIYDEAPLSEHEYVLLTLPGTPDANIPEAVQAEIGGTYDIWEDFSAFYTLTRVDDGWGFFSNPSDPPADDLEPVATATPRPRDIPPKLDSPVGSIITFGHYEQDGDLSNGPEPIEWRVLDVHGDQALVLSLFGLDAQPYHSTRKEITWEQCSLRAWMNDEFLNSAFTRDEHASIIPMLVINDRSQTSRGEFSADSGRNTIDQIFALSYAEFVKYFPDAEDERCQATDYAMQLRGLDLTDSQKRECWWWPRNPSYDGKLAEFIYMGDIPAGGSVNDLNFIRPAMWINLDTIGSIPVVTATPVPTAVPPAYRDSGDIILDNDTVTIMNQGKVLLHRGLPGQVVPAYKLMIINHTEQMISIRSDYMDNDTVDGRHVTVTFDNSVPIPVGGTQEVLLAVYGPGYGYKTVEELVNAVININVHSEKGEYWHHDYTLYLDRGASYQYQRHSGYLTGETDAFFYEIPNNWEVHDENDYAFYQQVCISPPYLGSTSIFVDTEEHSLETPDFKEALKASRDNDLWDTSTYERVIDGCNARIIRDIYNNSKNGENRYALKIFVNHGNEADIKISIQTDNQYSNELDDIIEHFLNSIRFKFDRYQPDETATHEPSPTPEPTPTPTLTLAPIPTPTPDEENGAAVSWPGIWRARQQDSESCLYIFPYEWGNGTYDVVLSSEKGGSAIALAGQLYLADEISEEFYAEGLLDAILVQTPETRSITLTPFSAMNDALLSWMELIEADYEYMGPLNDPDSQIPASVWELTRQWGNPVQGSDLESGEIAAAESVHYDDGVFAFDVPKEAVVTQSLKGDAWEVTVHMPQPQSLIDYYDSLDEFSNYGEPVPVLIFRMALNESGYWQDHSLSGRTAQELAQSFYAQNKAQSSINARFDDYLFQNMTCYGVSTEGYRKSYFTYDSRRDSFMPVSDQYSVWSTYLDYEDDDLNQRLSTVLSMITFNVPDSSAPNTFPVPNADAWLGHWTCIGGDYESHLYITEDDQGNYIPTFTFDTGHSFTGSSSQFDEYVIDLITDEFGCMLTLSPQLRTIVVSEIYTTVDAVNEWLDAHGRFLKYTLAESGTETQQPVASFPIVPEAPDSSMLPIAGKPGHRKVPVTRADATSWIESKKDPTAYIPQRMIDGDETTSYQFSTKVTRLGNAYLYFEFGGPVDLDELWIKNGFWKITDGKDQYTRNSRIKKMTVEYFSDGGSYNAQSFTLKDDRDRKDWTVLDLGRKTDVTAVRIRVDSIYQGSKYKNDVCVSEVMFVLKRDD